MNTGKNILRKKKASYDCIMSIFDIYVPLVVVIFRILYGARSVKYLFENTTQAVRQDVTQENDRRGGLTDSEGQCNDDNVLCPRGRLHVAARGFEARTLWLRVHGIMN